MQSTASTREWLISMFDAWSRKDDPGPFVAALADDLRWTVTGTSPIAGVYTSKAAYLAGVLGPLTERLIAVPTLHVSRMLVDGEWAALHCRDTAAANAARTTTWTIAG